VPSGGDSSRAQLPADDESEREQLAVIAAELVHLQALVQRVAERVPTGQRVLFRYDWLARDLQLVRDGVEQHFDAQRQPRQVTPLRGDYRR
jgi:RAQPRD family integrative conjugative element protein